MRKLFVGILGLLIVGHVLSADGAERCHPSDRIQVTTETSTETPVVPGQLVQWEQNGHYYAVLNQKLTWSEADQRAKSLLDGSGYLATITSKAENDFLVNMFGWPNIADYWLGAYQDPEVKEVKPEDYAKGWKWITGEKWEKTNWESTNPEPNNVNGGESYLQFVESKYEAGKWNDENNTGSGTAGYVVEWNHDPRNVDSIKVTGTIRDFKDDHPDFEAYTSNNVEEGIVKFMLGEDGKPVYNDMLKHKSITSADSFYQWYHDDSDVNKSKTFEITLTPDPNCTSTTPLYTIDIDNFFPIDDQLFGNQGRSHNYHFTYELHTYFTYTSPQELTFIGDDDVWVFINRQLVIDLGGVHPQKSASVNTGDLGLEKGKTYPLDFFFAERHTTQSHFKIQTGIALLPETLPHAITPKPTPVPPSEFTLGGGTVKRVPGSDVQVPVSVQNLPSSMAISFEIVYDPNVLTWKGNVIQERSMLESWGLVDANRITSGTLRFVGAALTGRQASGTGNLITVPFTLKNTATNGGVTEITFENLEDDVAEARSLPVTVAVGMKGDVDGNGRITAADVQLCFEIALGRKSPTAYQKWAAEVTDDNQITAADVQRIFQASLGIVDLFSFLAKKSNLETTKDSVSAKSISSFEIGTINGMPGETVIVPITIMPGNDIEAAMIDIVYDHAKLSFVDIDTTGTLLEDFALVGANESPAGTVRISAAALTADPVTDTGTLVNVQFQINPTASGSAAISIDAAYDDLEGASTTNGSINIGSSATPSPTPVPEPAATPFVQHVYIYDNPGDSEEDLTGQTDFDSAENRNLTIAWDAEQDNATDWHIYVRKGFGGAKYLGNTGSGTASSFDWYAGAQRIAQEFANGPDFNSVYSFCVIRLDGDLGPEDYFDMEFPVGFNLEGGNEVTLARPEIPKLNPGQVAIYDDILGGNDIAPMGSSGTDSDNADSNAIQIAWNFDRDPSTVNEYHVLVSVDGGEYEYLGQTFDGSINYFWWTPNNEFRTNAMFSEGPQDGHTYQFLVSLSPLTGERATLKSGILTYSIEEN